MTARDNHQIPVECNQCGARAQADVSEEDYYFTYMRTGFDRKINVALPFITKQEQDNDTVWCSTCNIRVW